MTAFEQRTSGIGSNRSAYSDTTYKIYFKARGYYTKDSVFAIDLIPTSPQYRPR